MAKAAYIGANGVGRKGKKMYCGDTAGLARKVKKGYLGDEKGVARLFYSGGPSVMYTGTHTITQIDIDEVTYNLLTMTGSGTLTVDGDVEFKAWICGGGGKGGRGYASSGSYATGGGGGAGGYVDDMVLPNGKYAVVIGAGNGGATTIGDVTANGGGTAKAESSISSYGLPVGGTGGTGGGTSGISLSSGNQSVNTMGKGAGVSTIPFELQAEFKHHSAGGGSGASYGLKGSKGGTNGGNGSSSGEGGAADDADGTHSGGLGGEYGGGNGGTYMQGYNAKSGTKGTYYGTGGGGGAAERNNGTIGSGGAGYQGVGYVLWNASEIEHIFTPLKIITHPESGTNGCTLTVEAVGDDLTYLWQRRTSSGGWSDFTGDGATTNTITGTASFFTSYYYRCKVTDKRGNALYTNSATVTYN